MTILEQVEADFKTAFKAKDESCLGALKMARAALKNAAIDKRGELSDEDVLDILGKEVKQRKETAETYKSVGDNERASVEEKEAEVLMKYLPKQLSGDEIEAFVNDKIKELGASGPSDMGKVMGVCMKELKQKADGKQVKNIVQSLLK